MHVQHRQPIQPNAYTSNHGRAALKWLDTMQKPDQWALTVHEQCELLGGVAKRTFMSWKAKARHGERVDLSRDTMDRLSLLLGIYKSLKICIR